MPPSIEPRLLQGFRDYPPALMMPRERVLQAARVVYRSYGYAPIDTPALEFAEVLLGKGGGENDKLVYRFRDQGDRDVALRFDLTVPFARFAAMHVPQLGVPFKRYAMGPVWRGERPKAAEHGLGSGCARFGAGETLAGGRRSEVRGGDNDYFRDRRMAAEGIDGPVDNAAPEQGLPLLRFAGSCPVSLASGDDNGGCTTHRAASSGAGPVWPYYRTSLAYCTKIVLLTICALAWASKVVKKE